MDHITDRVFIGNLQAALNLQALKKEGITHILQVAGGVSPMFPQKFVYKTINVADNAQTSLIRHFPAIIAFIKQGVQAGGVLVHCYAGVSRSATCVIAYLMQEKNMSFQQAFQFASNRRPIIFPNMGFQRQLAEFERLLDVKKAFASPNRLHINRNSVENGTFVKMKSPVLKGPKQIQFEDQQETDFKKTGNPYMRQTQREDAFAFKGGATLTNFNDIGRSTLGFAPDRLGQLMEENKMQAEKALQQIRGRKRLSGSMKRGISQSAVLTEYPNSAGQVLSGVKVLEKVASVGSDVDKIRSQPKQDGSASFNCVSCDGLLFTSKDLLAHLNRQPVQNSIYESSTECKCFFVRQQAWMPNSESGILQCPNDNCGLKLGKFAKAGVRCTCGQLVKPGFQIVKHKVRIVGGSNVTFATTQNYEFQPPQNRRIAKPTQLYMTNAFSQPQSALMVRSGYGRNFAETRPDLQNLLDPKKIHSYLNQKRQLQQSQQVVSEKKQEMLDLQRRNASERSQKFSTGQKIVEATQFQVNVNRLNPITISLNSGSGKNLPQIGHNLLKPVNLGLQIRL